MISSRSNRTTNLYKLTALVVALAGMCLAPECTEASDLEDAGLDLDAGSDATTGATKRQKDATIDCQKRGACVIESGGAFSQSECETATRNEAERADSRSCTDAYDAYLSCLTGITYDCTENVTAQILAACNPESQTLGTCLN